MKREFELHYGNDARKALKRGVDTIANAVKVTYGARGRNVLISNPNGRPPHITKDGVTVAKSIEVQDALERQGALLIQSAANSANSEAGDGSTLTTILTQALVNEGLNLLDNDTHVNPIDLKRGMDYAKEQVVEILKETATPVNDINSIRNVATVSANNDKFIGDIIAQAFAKVGRHGVVSYDNSENHKTYVEHVDGYQFDRGLITPYFITDTQRLRSVMNNPFILVTDQVLSNPAVFEKIVTEIYDHNTSNGVSRGLVVICDDMEFECVKLFLKNHTSGHMKFAVIKSPEFGDRRYDMLRDICVVTGATFVSKEKGDDISKLSLEHLGEANQVIADLENTTIVGGQGDVDEIKKRVDEIKEQLKNKVGYDQEVYEKRLGKLTGGASIIKLGATSEVDLQELKDRVEDAISAVKASVEEGIVAGGGSFLFKVASGLYEIPYNSNLNEDEHKGVGLVLNALKVPNRTLLENAFLTMEDSAFEEVYRQNEDYGYNVITKEFTNMFEAGIVDPAKVIRLAVENAVSVVGTMLLTEAIVLGEDYNESKPRLPIL